MKNAMEIINAIVNKIMSVRNFLNLKKSSGIPYIMLLVLMALAMVIALEYVNGR